MCKKMTDEKHNTIRAKTGPVPVILFALFLGLYILNVLIGKAIIVFGWEVFHFGNVGEFLILLTASVAFIVAALQAETVRNNRKSEKKEDVA
jgi:hypothetical protein